MFRSMMLISFCYLFCNVFMQTLKADIINQESYKTHHRLNIIVPKDQVFVKKEKQQVLIQTLNLSLFEQLSLELKKQSLNQTYFNKASYSQENFPESPATIAIDLKNDSIELFSFYRDPEKKFILDFWANNEIKESSKITEAKPLAPEYLEKEIAKSKPRPIPKNLKKPTGSILEIVEIPQIIDKTTNPDYRDFRYGANFIWDYKPLIPPLERDINLESKLPESLYPINNRENLDDPREAHLQLSINFYRQEKFGLMNKSINLFETKYGKNKDRIVNDYLRVNSILRSNIVKKEKPLMLTSMSLLSQILERTDEYQFKRALYRYLLQFHVDQKDTIKSIELAKKFFVEARAEFDHEMVILSAQIILHHLALLKQNQKINDFLSDKKLMAILPAQIGAAYRSYSFLLDGKTKDIIRSYEETKSALVKPVHPSILFNTAESYFREADYDKSFQLFDELAADYSYVLHTSYARLRMALIYDLLDKPVNETLVLYRKAIDRSTLSDVRYEAKVRFVALSIPRKIKTEANDQDSEVFLEQSPDETKIMTLDLKKLLWVVRLRVLIVKKQYQEALAYLTTIPVDTLKPAEKRVFDGDGAEIVFGTIQDLYMKEEYSKAVKIWEIYRQKYEAKVAKNPYMNFLVADSFLKLGLTKSFDRSLKDLELSEETIREYPEWVGRVKNQPLKEYLDELSLLKLVHLSQWKEAESKMALLPVSVRNSVTFSFYEGLIHYNQRKYAEASESFENVLSEINAKNNLSPRQMADLLMAYVDSLYQLKDTDRFRTIVRALSLDIEKSKSAQILNISERVNYLIVESLSGELKPNYGELEMLTRSFKNKFPKSPYISRIEYLLGISLIRSDKVKEGKNILQELTTEEKAPGYIREMARTELSALELKNKKI